jgi:hypothetical protein
MVNATVKFLFAFCPSKILKIGPLSINAKIEDFMPNLLIINVLKNKENAVE